MVRSLTAVFVSAVLCGVVDTVEAATVDVPLKCNANVEFYADIGDTINFQWVDPSTGVKWADSLCSDDPVGRDDAVYNSTRGSRDAPNCTDPTLTGFLLFPNTTAGNTRCGWRWYRWRGPNTNPPDLHYNDTFTAELLLTNDGGRELVQGDVVAELWLNFYATYTSDPQVHYDIIWKGPANAPAPANAASSVSVAVSTPPSVPVPTLPTILLMVMSGLLALFGFCRVGASK